MNQATPALTFLKPKLLLILHNNLPPFLEAQSAPYVAKSHKLENGLCSRPKFYLYLPYIDQILGQFRKYLLASNHSLFHSVARLSLSARQTYYILHIKHSPYMLYMGVGANSLFHGHNTINSLPHTSERPGLRDTEMKWLFGASNAEFISRTSFRGILEKMLHCYNSLSSFEVTSDGRSVPKIWGSVVVYLKYEDQSSSTRSG